MNSSPQADSQSTPTSSSNDATSDPSHWIVGTWNCLAPDHSATDVLTFGPDGTLATSFNYGNQTYSLSPPDDNEVTINNRLKVYEAQTKPLIEYYRNQGRLEIVNGVGEVDEIFRRLLVVLDPVAKGLRKPKLPPPPPAKPVKHIKSAVPVKAKPVKPAGKPFVKMPAKPQPKKSPLKLPAKQKPAAKPARAKSKPAKTAKHLAKKSRARR